MTLQSLTPVPAKPELVCPAGSLRALQLAVDAGADAVYLGLKDATNARNFAGLNFDDAQVRDGVAYAHARGAKVLMALNTFADARDIGPWQRAVDTAVAMGADALIVADTAVMAYCRDQHPALRLHLSVQASATSYEAIEFYRERYAIQRAVLPRVLTMSQVGHVIRHTPVDIEVFGFGSLCVMVEGRCALSSYVTGQSPNTAGVCSPPSAVRWQDTPTGVESRLNGVLIDRYAADEPRGYPTLCKGRFRTERSEGYLFEEPVSLDALELLPELQRAGVSALKIEGRQRGRAYVEQVVRRFRSAIDGLGDADRAPGGDLTTMSEGQAMTTGAYRKRWR